MPDRNRLLAKIHILKKKVNLPDAEYQAILRDRFGVGSSKDLSAPDQRMLAGILRGLDTSDKYDQSDLSDINIMRTSGKIWRKFYELQDHIGRRSANYLAGIIGKVCGEECERNIWQGAKLNLDRLTPYQAHKVIEALKERLQWQEDQESAASCRTVPALDEKARKAGIRDRRTGRTSQTCRTRTREEEEELNAQLAAAVPF